jgi:NADH:ubiquinone oxidoreductase subunit 4 (subunit M)
MSMILPIVTFLPLLGALMCLLIPREEVGLQRGIGMGTALVTFLASLMMLGGGFDPTKMNYEVKWDWAPRWASTFTWASTASRCGWCC